MTDDDIPIKTAAGTDEVKSRARRLVPRLRTLLIMIDGKATAAQLRQSGATIGAPADGLEQLLAEGLVAVAEPPTRAPAVAGPAVVVGSAPPAAAPVQPGAGSAEPPTSVGGDRLRAAQKMMNDVAVASMGLRAFFFTLKLEKCFASEDLLALLPELSKAVAKKDGEEAVRTLETRLRQMLH